MRLSRTPLFAGLAAMATDVIERKVLVVPVVFAAMERVGFWRSRKKVALDEELPVTPVEQARADRAA